MCRRSGSQTSAASTTLIYPFTLHVGFPFNQYTSNSSSSSLTESPTTPESNTANSNSESNQLGRPASKMNYSTLKRLSQTRTKPELNEADLEESFVRGQLLLSSFPSPSPLPQTLETAKEERKVRTEEKISRHEKKRRGNEEEISVSHAHLHDLSPL